VLARDPLAVVHHMEAWMPEKIAAYKLRGFVQDAGGDIVESVPGRIRVRVGGKGSVYAAPSRRGFSFLGLGRRQTPIDLELLLEHADEGRGNQLRITVVFLPPGSEVATDPTWRSVCTQIFCDLRASLMAHTVGLRTESAD
jgi:serine/threonine-protein kinase